MWIYPVSSIEVVKSSETLEILGLKKAVQDNYHNTVTWLQCRMRNKWMVHKVILLITPTVSQLKAQRRNCILLLITVCVLLPEDLFPLLQKKKKIHKIQGVCGCSKVNDADLAPLCQKAVPELFVGVTKTLRDSCEGETYIWSQTCMNLWLGQFVTVPFTSIKSSHIFSPLYQTTVMLRKQHPTAEWRNFSPLLRSSGSSVCRFLQWKNQRAWKIEHMITMSHTLIAMRIFSLFFFFG